LEFTGSAANATATIFYAEGKLNDKTMHYPSATAPRLGDVLHNVGKAPLILKLVIRWS
jgi:hypothetical protein